ncbi:hypothetical protein ASF88_01915 [Leifsonia sp. Leaf336]|nr:hypothetical protein ASF88_01915 [Leifsonia sp. Leaf336]
MPMRMDGDAAKAVRGVSSDIQRVLAGDAAYDELGERGQAVVRAIWDEKMTNRLARLDLATEFTRENRSWIEADERGKAVVHGENSSQARITSAGRPVPRPARGPAQADSPAPKSRLDPA